MRNNCFVPSKENNRNVEQLAREIEGPTLGSNAAPSASSLKLAYFLLANNLGLMPDLMPTSSGSKKSVLFLNLVKTLGSVSAAYKAKAYIYTQEFAERYGEWVGQYDEDGNLLPEPMWKEEFANDWVNDTFDISTSTRDDLDVYLFKNTYNTVLDDGVVSKIHLYDADPNALSKTIDEDRTNKIDKWIAEGKSEYPEKDAELLNIVNEVANRYTDEEQRARDLAIERAKRLFYKNVYNEKLLNKLINGARESMMSVWGLEADPNTGLAINNIDEKEDSKTHDIVQIRCNIVNALIDTSDNYLLKNTNNRQIVYNVVLNYLSGMPAPSVASSMFTSYLDLYKDTKLMQDILLDTNLLKPKSNSKDYKQSDIDKAFTELKKMFRKSINPYTNEKTPSKAKKTWQSVVSGLLSVTDTVMFALALTTKSLAGKISTYTTALISGLAIAFASGTMPMIITAAGSLGLAYAASKVAQSYVKKEYGESAELIDLRSWGVFRKKRTESIQKLMMAISLNKELSLEFGKYQYGDNNFISDILTRQSGGVLQVVFGRIMENLQSQVKAMKEDEDASAIKALIYKLEEAIKHHKTDKYYAYLFFQQYLKYAQLQLDDAYKYMNDVKLDIEHLDVNRLFKIKTDIIGAYDTTIRVYLNAYMNDLPMEDLNEGGLLFDLVKTIVNGLLSRAKQEFSIVLAKYCDYYADQVLNETAGRVIDEDMRTNMKNNISYWFKNKINNYGQLSIPERLITPARSSTSTVVRMLKQKMEEITQEAESNSNRVGQMLENIRTKNRSFGDRISLLNQCSKYMETSSDDLFTGNFVSDTNVGEYQYLSLKEKEFLYKKYDVELDEYDDPIWKDELLWKDWNTDYAIWMAGGKRTDKGQYEKPTDNKNVRLNRRYNLQYYLDKINILGKEGTDILADINKSIALIEKTCRQQIKYTDKSGKEITRTFANLAKLPLDTLIRLQELLNRKKLLSSFYEIKWNREHTKIQKIELKTSEKDIELAKRFQEWDQQKGTYYTGKPKIDWDFYNAVTQYYENSGLQKEQALFTKLYTQVEYNPIILNSFKINGKTIYRLKDNNGKDIEPCRRIVSLLRLRSTLRFIINSNNSKRTPDLSMIGNDISSKETADLWKQIVEIEKEILSLLEQIDKTDKSSSISEKLVNHVKIAPSVNMGKVNRDTYTTREYVPTLDPVTGEDDRSLMFYKKLLNKNSYLRRSDLLQSDGKYEVPFFSRETLNFSAYTHFGTQVQPGEFYMKVPQLIFKTGESSQANENFDPSSEDYVLVNKTFKDSDGKSPFDNSEKYDQIKDDPFYKMLIQIMDSAWENYQGLTRSYRYMLPQREGSVSDQFGRAFSQMHNFKSGIKEAFSRTFGDLTDFNTRDLDYRDDVIVRPDGTIVETIGSRWTKKLKKRNNIDSDLVSSVIDFYQESLKYNLRKKYAPLMELMHFELTGGYDKASDVSSRHQADVIRHEMSKILYGRTYTGSGQNGRITPDERTAAKLTKTFRSVLHTRLMSHNWLSVLKNAWDSMCNLCQAAMTAKYILTRNIIKALTYLIYDPKANGLARFAIGSLIGGINRSSATNMTLALGQMNGVFGNVHERFEGQNKWAIRRMLGKTKSIEFEGIDYTSKAIIINSVYDAYRLMLNPNTGKYEFLNEEEAELAYMSHGSANGRQDGYNAWVAAGALNLRNMYHQDEYGNAVLNEYVYVSGPVADEKTGIIKEGVHKLKLIDIVRPVSKISSYDYSTVEEIVDNDGKKLMQIAQKQDRRSRVLETKIMTTIKQMCQTVNGMLEDMDKSQAATHYAGSLLFTFRGWMVSQSSEFYKNGVDFLDYRRDTDLQVSLAKWAEDHLSEQIPMRSKGVLTNDDYEGMYNFTTGTIDKGLHKNLLKNLWMHLGAFAKMLLIIPNFLPKNANILGFNISSSKQRMISPEGGMSQSLFYQLRNFAAAMNAFALTIFMTVLTFSIYSGNGDGDGDDNKGLMSDKAMKSLIYTAMLASISERFPQLGTGAFLVNISDIVNSLSVGVTLLDDAKYLVSLGFDLLNLLESNINDNYQFDSDETFGILSNGSFKGKSKMQRNITRAAAMLGIDSAPFLLSLDAYNKYSEYLPDYMLLPDPIKDQMWIEYNLNLYKNMTESGNVGRAKFYQGIIPTNILVPLLGLTPFKIAPDTSKKKSGVTKSSSYGQALTE